ncbi:DUF4247 domain-containing protein [Mycolicibacterium lacusdiani]|uniref:DUF4247 domain-containing protein n=1 Tax=Mycolicibacterium lacusdiani TaxID=2895283 RepID=UPI001F274B29|nr:DUF4247 domain-containing protein [Mycolicibacterium lacusdiani]
MSRGRLFLLSGVLALAAVLCLALGASATPDIRSHIDRTYQRYATTADANLYECSGQPASVADDLSAVAAPDARATDRGSEYLRYEDDIVVVGPDGNRPCTIRVEDINSGYRGGGFIFLGPGFFPGSPAGGSGGGSGGPDGPK